MSAKTESFDPFGSNSVASSFDPFSNNGTVPPPDNKPVVFEAFGNSPTNQFAANFQDFSFPAASAVPSNMPFIKTTPEVIPSPADLPQKEIAKNFGAFDDLFSPATHSQTVAPSANPFDFALGPNQPNNPSHSQANPAHQNPQLSYPTNQYYNHNLPPINPYIAPGQYNQGYVQQYQPTLAPYGHSGYQQYGYGPQYPYPQQAQFNPQVYGAVNSMPQQQVQYATTANQPPNKSPVLTAQPDPFSDMTGLALINLNKAAPASLARVNIEAAKADTMLSASANESQTKISASVNPFDLFG